MGQWARTCSGKCQLVEIPSENLQCRTQVSSNIGENQLRTLSGEFNWYRNTDRELKVIIKLNRYRNMDRELEVTSSIERNTVLIYTVFRNRQSKWTFKWTRQNHYQQRNYLFTQFLLAMRRLANSGSHVIWSERLLQPFRYCEIDSILWNRLISALFTWKSLHCIWKHDVMYMPKN